MIIKEGNGGVVRGDKLRVWDYPVHIAIHKTGNPQGPIVAHCTQYLAISHSGKQSEKEYMKVKSRSHVQLSVTPWTVAYQAPPSMGFSRQVY